MNSVQRETLFLLWIMNKIKGSFIPGMLLELVILAITGAVVVRLLHISVQEAFHIRNRQKLENNISRTLASLYSATHRSPVVWGLPLYQWRKEGDLYPPYLEAAIRNLQETNTIKPGSVFLESLDAGPVLLFKPEDETSDQFTGKIQNRYLTSVRDDRWIALSASGVFRIREKPTVRYIHESDTWEVTFLNYHSKEHILHSLPETVLKHAESIFQVAMPLRDHVLHYINTESELRRFSLITRDNQPVSGNITDIIQDNDDCYISASVHAITARQKFPCANNPFEPFLYYDFLDF
jgi:hypothetical protein